MTRIAAAKTGPAFSEARTLEEQLQASVEAFSHRLWTDAELNQAHAEIARLLREGPPRRVQLTELGMEVTDNA